MIILWIFIALFYSTPCHELLMLFGSTKNNDVLCQAWCTAHFIHPKFIIMMGHICKTLIEGTDRGVITRFTRQIFLKKMIISKLILTFTICDRVQAENGKKYPQHFFAPEWPKDQLEAIIFAAGYSFHLPLRPFSLYAQNMGQKIIIITS